MDTEYDFIKPEFLHILFFQQKNLVVYPYVDLKNLRSLEPFTAGYNIVDLESTALANLKEIFEYDLNNSYSQTPTLYLVVGIDKEKLKDVMSIKGVRCVLNSNDLNVSKLANGSNFVFYNKKTSSFVNFDASKVDLEFEKEILASSKNEAILRDNVLKIKSAATQIFTEISDGNNLNTIAEILAPFNRRYWQKILDYTTLYFNIDVPAFDKIPDSNIIEKQSLKEKKKGKASTDIANTKDNSAEDEFLKEYDLLLSFNKDISKEFFAQIFDYRSQKVNAQHLELEQLFDPKELYKYLRTHHWQKEMPKEFLENWVHMSKTNHALTEKDVNDFEKIFMMFNVSEEIANEILPKMVNIEDNESVSSLQQKSSDYRSLINDFNKFKKSILNRLDDLEDLLK